MIKIEIKNILKWSSVLFAFIVAGCKTGKTGAPSPTNNTVSIVGATCASNNSSITLNLYNSAPYEAIVYAVNYFEMAYGGVVCSSGNDFWYFSKSPSAASFTIPANSNTEVTLSICFHRPNQHSPTTQGPCASVTPSTIFACSVAPFSTSQGMFIHSSQSLSCTAS